MVKVWLGGLPYWVQQDLVSMAVELLRNALCNGSVEEVCPVGGASACVCPSANHQGAGTNTCVSLLTGKLISSEKEFVLIGECRACSIDYIAGELAGI